MTILSDETTTGSVTLFCVPFNYIGRSPYVKLAQSGSGRIVTNDNGGGWMNWHAAVDAKFTGDAGLYAYAHKAFINECRCEEMDGPPHAVLTKCGDLMADMIGVWVLVNGRQIGYSEASK